METTALFQQIQQAISGEAIRSFAEQFRQFPLKLSFSSYAEGIHFLAEQYRSFGLERTVGVPTAFTYDGQLPDRYDYEALFDDPFGPFGHDKEINAVLKFDSFHGFYNIERNWPDAVKIETLPDETVIMRAKTRSYSGIRKYILSFGTGVEVLEPEWLRNAIRDWHQKAADMYGPAKSEESSDNVTE